MSLVLLSRELSAKGQPHVFVSAATLRTSLFAITTDIAKRLTGAIRAVEAGKIHIQQQNVKVTETGDTRFGWCLPLTKLLPKGYFQKRTRSTGADYRSIPRMLAELQQLRVAVVDSRVPMPTHGNAKSPFAYYYPAMKLIVVPNRVDRDTVEHELRHAIDDATKIIQGGWTDYKSDSYTNYGTAYLAEPREIAARLQAWVRAVRAVLDATVKRAQGANQALRLEYGEENRKLGYKPDAAFVLHNIERANEARAFLKRVLFYTPGRTDQGLLAFVDAMYRTKVTTDGGFAVPESFVDRDSSRLIDLTRDPVREYLSTGKVTNVIPDIEHATYVVSEQLRAIYTDLRNEYASVNLRQITTTPKTGKGSRTPLKPSDEWTPEPGLPFDADLKRRADLLRYDRPTTKTKSRKGNA